MGSQVFASNGASANVVHRDLDIFNVTQFLEIVKYVISEKLIRASEKCSSTTFIEFDISHRVASSRKLCIVIHILNVNI